MGSRLRDCPSKIFECFCEVVIPSTCNESAWILQKFPESYKDEEILKSVPEFSYPCEFVNNAVQHFSFVLTSIDSKWTFGYCRHAPDSPTCFVILSHLPWHETFYKVLNHIAELANRKESGDLGRYLTSLYNTEVPEPGFLLQVAYNQGQAVFTCHCSDHTKLPSIPENRNLTEYFNAVDAHNMMVLFASMLHERRILITSKRLSRLSACVQAANSLIYPMQWQHIFIPVLPNHLLDYLSAPMPFLIGVPISTMARVKRPELGEVVLLDADNNKVETPFQDLQTMPTEIVSTLKKNLKNPSMMLGDGVAQAFLRALVHLMGGYRTALKFQQGQKISFDPDLFLQSRPPNMRIFLEKILQLQIFQQFIEGRLQMLNSGEGFNDVFELEVNMFDDKSSKQLKMHYKEWVNQMKKEGGALLKSVKNKANPAMKHAYKSVKDKSKRAYKDIRLKVQEIQQKGTQDDLSLGHRAKEQPKSAPASPTLARNRPLTLLDPTDTKSYLINSRPLQLTPSSDRARRLEQVDEVAVEASEESSDTESGTNFSLQRLDMDLMGDLQDLLFKKTSLTAPDSDSASQASQELFIDSTMKNSFNNPSLHKNLSSLPSTPAHINSKPGSVLVPLPPPRGRRKNSNPLTGGQGTEDTPLIRLDSQEDEMNNLDPLMSKSSISVPERTSSGAIQSSSFQVRSESSASLPAYPSNQSNPLYQFYQPLPVQRSAAFPVQFNSNGTALPLMAHNPKNPFTSQTSGNISQSQPAFPTPPVVSPVPFSYTPFRPVAQGNWPVSSSSAPSVSSGPTRPVGLYSTNQVHSSVPSKPDPFADLIDLKGQRS